MNIFNKINNIVQAAILIWLYTMIQLVLNSSN